MQKLFQQLLLKKAPTYTFLLSTGRNMVENSSSIFLSSVSQRLNTVLLYYWGLKEADPQSPLSAVCLDPECVNLTFMHLVITSQQTEILCCA